MTVLKSQHFRKLDPDPTSEKKVGSGSVSKSKAGSGFASMSKFRSCGGSKWSNRGGP
jgi:hypothetical protein